MKTKEERNLPIMLNGSHCHDCYYKTPVTRGRNQQEICNLVIMGVMHKSSIWVDRWLMPEGSIAIPIFEIKFEFDSDETTWLIIQPNSKMINGNGYKTKDCFTELLFESYYEGLMSLKERLSKLNPKDYGLTDDDIKPLVEIFNDYISHIESLEFYVDDDGKKYAVVDALCICFYPQVLMSNQF